MSSLTEAFAVLRDDEVGEPELWRPIYRRGLVEAFRDSRLDEAAELAVFAASALEAQGRYEEAVSELEFAIPRATGSPEATATLLGTLAITHAFRGEAAAFAAIDAASALEQRVQSRYGQIMLQSLMATVDLIFLKRGAVSRAARAARSARDSGFTWVGLGLDIWAIPALLAEGRLRHARPWAYAFSAETEAVHMPYRRADAAAIDYCLRSIVAPTPLEPSPFEQMRRNRMAAWRAHAAGIRGAFLQQNPAEAEGHIAAMEDLAGYLNPGHLYGLPAFRAAASYSAGESADADGLNPPATLTLVNLPGTVAALEVVAAVGTQEQAVEWLRWSDAEIPAGVVSSMEWPASIERLRALLMARAGRERAGIGMLERALRRTSGDDYQTENALCAVQLAELLALAGSVSQRRWSALRRDGRSNLRSVGIDPIPMAAIATDALAWGRVYEAAPRLSPRETQVLALLAEGLTYRAAASRLGIEWRTVQVHASHIYEKLGVSGKIAAARRAQELGIL